MELNQSILGVVDYIIFALMLLISAGIGIYIRFSGGQPKTTEEYLLAGRNMPVLPVAVSLMATFQSAITTIGFPAEVYRCGISLAYMCLGYIIGMILTALLTTPVYFQLQSPSAYEYLDRRFGKFARTYASAAFVIQMILFMSVVLYAPAVAMSAVTNMSIWVSIVSIGVVCTFYCTLGGMKAVLWTDLFQGALMLLSILAVVVMGLADMGFGEVYGRAAEGGRMAFPSWEFDFKVRYSVWSILAQGICFSMFSYGGSQIQIQRLMTVKSLSHAQMALYLNIPMTCLFHLLSCAAGIIIYAYFARCDPILAPGSHLSSQDQLLPYYVMSTLGQYPGLPGLFMCGVFSSSLSTVSSVVNSLTAVTTQDFVRPFLLARGRSLDKMVFGAKLLTFFFGFVGVALAFVVAQVGNLAQAALTVNGLLGTPVLGILLLGMITTRTNQKGAVTGLLSGVALAAWISFGASLHGSHKEWLPVSTEECAPLPNSTLNEIMDSSTMTSSLMSSTFASPLREEDIFFLYRISYVWFSTIGLVSTMIIAYIMSILCNIFDGPAKDIPDELLSPFGKRFWKAKGKLQKGKDFITEIPPELEKRQEPLAIYVGVSADKERSPKDEVSVTESSRNELQNQKDVPVATGQSERGAQVLKETNKHSEISESETL